MASRNMQASPFAPEAKGGANPQISQKTDLQITQIAEIVGLKYSLVFGYSVRLGFSLGRLFFSKPICLTLSL